MEYRDFSSVEKQREFLTAEEFPEGPYGHPQGKKHPVDKKSAKRPPIGEDRTSPTEEAIAAAAWGGAHHTDGAWS